MNYGIKDYISNDNPSHHNDVSYTDEGQRDVYEFCFEFMMQKNLHKIVDVGCGSGYKLINILGCFDTIGIETEPCYSFLLNKYPSRKWLISGENEKTFKKYDELAKPDVVICSDVIEHIVNPDTLLDFLLSLNSKYYIISTPCRYILCNHPKFRNHFERSWNGPPINPCHVREWTMNEFKEYMKTRFNIVTSYYGKEQIECQYHLLISKN